MGWAGTTDPLASLELKFPTVESAIRYACRQGLAFVVEKAPATSGVPPSSPLHENGTTAVIQRHVD